MACQCDELQWNTQTDYSHEQAGVKVGDKFKRFLADLLLIDNDNNLGGNNKTNKKGVILILNKCIS